MVFVWLSNRLSLHTKIKFLPKLLVTVLLCYCFCAGDSESVRTSAIEQLCAALRFPAADAGTILTGLQFLATHAFLHVSDQYLTAIKKKAQQQVLQHAAGTVQPMSAPLRRLCAARLMTLVTSLGRQLQPSAIEQEVAGQDVVGTNISGGKRKKRKTEQQQGQQQAAKQQYPVQDVKQQNALLKDVLDFVSAAQQSTAGVDSAVPLPAPAAAAMQGLQHIDTALEELLSQVPCNGATAGTAAASSKVTVQHSRARALLRLVRLLQLQLLGDADRLDVKLVDDLRMVAVEGLGVAVQDNNSDEDDDDILDEDDDDDDDVDDDVKQAAAAAGKRQIRGRRPTKAALEKDAADDDAAGDDDDGDDDDDASPHWMDVLLDVLLSLLADHDSSGSSLPSAPVRHAAEALFRSTAEELTVTGEWYWHCRV